MRETILLLESTLQRSNWKARNIHVFNCNLNKKRLEKAQFEELHVVEKKPDGEEIKVVTEQKAEEWELEFVLGRKENN